MGTAIGKIRVSVLLWPLWLGALACTSGPQVGETTSQAVLDQYLARPAMRGARLGILIQELETGRVLVEEGADQGFSPASTMKLLTASSALAHLPADFRFRTHLYMRGKIVDGTLHGDLILVCPGDPSFGWIPEYGGPGDADFDEFVEALDRWGVKAVEGRLLAYASPSPGAKAGAWPPKTPQPWIWRSGWEWDDFVYGWGAEIGDFVYHGNRVSVRAVDGPEGVQVSVLPKGSGIRFREAVRVEKGARSDLQIFGLPKQRDWILQGSLDLGGKDRVWAAVPDPAVFLLNAFRARLAKEGLSMKVTVGRGRHPLPPGDPMQGQTVQALAVHASPPRDDLLRVMLHRSDNLYAERLAWASAFMDRGVPSFEALQPDAVTDTTARSLSALGVDPSTLRLVDGSGLSRRNLLNPRAVVALLSRLAAQPGPAFADRLALAGGNGTLRRRFGPQSRWHRQIRAKTGTITGITALAGYLLPQAGRKMVFCVYLERPHGRAAVGRAFVDALLEALAPTLP